MSTNARPPMPSSVVVRSRAMTRELRRHPGYKISKDGQVFAGLSSSPLPLETRDGRYQKLLTVRIGDIWERIDLLLSEAFYSGAVVIPRDGNILDLRADNVIAVEKLPTFNSHFKVLDGDKAQWIWTCYERNRVRVAFLAEKSGLAHFFPEDFVRIIKAILAEGIRL